MEESSYYKEGMVGVSMTGDIRMRSFVTQGARRVGPTFHADKVRYYLYSCILTVLVGREEAHTEK